MTELILASGSFIRRQLLQSAGLKLRVEPAHINEVLPDNAHPRDAAIALSLAKAWDVAQRFPDAVVIGSDQVMMQGPQLLAKAEDRKQARRRLTAMAGRWHWFYPAAAVVGPNFEEVIVEEAAVRFRPLQAQEIEAYLDTGEWQGCAGCYQIENQGANLVAEVRGSLHAVLGMPLFGLLQVLRDAGISALSSD